MKILVNWRDAICNDCGQRECATVYGNKVICSFCLGDNLKNTHWYQFVPKWKIDARNPTRKNWSHHLRRFNDLHPERSPRCI